jgi:acetyl esterase
MGLGFARRGFLVFSINYRLAPRHPYPAAVEDVCRALAWVGQHAERFGGDPSRLVLAGESAGANLVTALAVATSYRRPEPFAREVFDTGLSPAACLPACGILQVSDAGRFARRRPLSPVVAGRLRAVGRVYLGERHDDVGHPELDLADPLVFLERGQSPDRPLPRFYVPVGTRDPLLDDTRRLGLALGRLNVHHQVAFYPGELHAFHALHWRPAARRCWQEMQAFIETSFREHAVARAA